MNILLYLDTMLEFIWGLKTVAIFDVWTIEHALTGVSVGSAVRKKNHSIFKKLFGLEKPEKHPIHFDLTGVLCLAFAWETLEHYIETGLFGSAVEYWFQGIEFWPNRLLADPILLVIGYYISKRYPRLIVPARFLSVIWLAVHIFAFPHSMYLHEIF